MNWQYEKNRIYSSDENGKLLAEATFFQTPNGEMNIDHTFVSPDLRGQGIAGEIMKAAAEYVRGQRLKTTATCSYAYMWLKRHEKSYSDIISDDIDNQNIACKIDSRR